VPPRTRATASTAPVGRRPKVAGLRAPGRPGVTAESTRPVGPHDDEADEPDTALADTAGPDDAAAPAADGSHASDDSDAPDGAAPAAAATTDATTDDGEATTAVADRPASTSKAPTSKARRSQGASSAAASPRSGDGPRSGTALLDRPEPERRPREATPKKASSQRPGRFAGLLAPFRRLAEKPRALMGVMAAVIVVCLVLGGLAFWQGRQAWTQGPVSNGAVVDVGGTAEVVGQTRQAMEQILSYDFAKLDDSVNAAKTQSTGAFTSQYLQVFEQTIRGPAEQQKLRQTASVLNIGVQQLSGDHATLMALVQFTAERTTNQQTTNAPGLLTVQVVRQDGRWKISELKPM
jgi:Mce-associated membrane protein